MKYTKLGLTNIEVSRICVGGMSFGERFPDWHQWCLNAKDTEQMIAHAWELGVNFIDTANVYAKGTSASYIGENVKFG